MAKKAGAKDAAGESKTTRKTSRRSTSAAATKKTTTGKAAKAVEPKAKAVEPKAKAVEPKAKAVEPKTKAVEPKTGAKAKPGTRRTIRCYLCGASFEVSAKTMSTTCAGCHKAIKVEDLNVKSYVPVNDLQTCGNIKVTRRGRIAARRIQAGRGIACEGTMEGAVETDGTISLGSKAAWKGKTLQSRTLAVADGATLVGHVCVPWIRE